MKLTEHIPNFIYTVEDFFTIDECKAQIAWSEKRGYEEAKITAFGKQVLVTQVRNNSRIMFKNEILATEVWKKVEPFCVQKIGGSVAIGLNEMFRFYKYERGQKFRSHYDGSYERSDTEFSMYTLMIYLNEDFLGGDIWFEQITIQPKIGMALIFKHDILHEGQEVIKGKKYVLRTDVMYKFQS